MIDIHEFLGRGIIAARAGKTAEAVHYLTVTTRFWSKNPRAWLWLAAVSPAPEEQRYCLQKAVELDPKSLAAKILLDRARGTEQTSPGTLAEVRAFQCPKCGGRQQFDPDCASLTCVYCGRVEQLAVPRAGDAEQDLGAALSESGAGNWALVSEQITCEGCGAIILVPADSSSSICPFCASPKVLVKPSTPDLMLPHAIAPFVFGIDEARQHIRQWLGRGLFIPDDLVRLAHSRDLYGIYLPFWTFDAQVQVRCLVNYRLSPKIYSQTSRLVDYGQLLPQLWYEKDIDDMLIYAGRSRSWKLLQAIMPFNVKAVVEYTPEFLAGWQAEVYQLSLVDAAQEAYTQMRDQATRSFDADGVTQDYRNFLEDDIVVAKRTYKLILLPIWVGTFVYQHKTYQVLVNGQTGKVAGEKPIAWGKVLLAEIGAILILGLLILLGIFVWSVWR